MAVKIKGKTYKGKYKGPDRFKGNEKKIKAWKASKRKASSPASEASPTTAAPTPAASPAPGPDDTAAGNSSAYPSSNAASNSSGTVQLQSTADIEGAVLEAEEAKKKADSEATMLEQQSAITKAVQEEQHRQGARETRGQVNAANAYRGLRGTSALRRRSNNESNLTEQKNSIEEQARQTNEQARQRRLEGENYATSVGKWATLKRQEHTNERSKDNPTEGSQAEDAGVRPTTTPAENKPKPNAPSIKPSPKPKTKSYKGKYPGPDKFKGNKKKIAAWKAAKRKAGK